MENQLIQVILVSCLGSAGLFSFLQFLIDRRSALTEAVQAMLRDRILMLSKKYLQDGEWELHERDNYASLYVAYKGIKGNTFVDDLYKDVIDLPLKK